VNPFAQTILVMLAITPVLVLAIAWGLYCAPARMRPIAEPMLLLLSSILMLGVVVAGLIFRLPLGEMGVALLIGWFNVSERAVPRIELNAAGIATGVVCVAITLVLLHRLAAWIYGEVVTKQQRITWPPAWRWSWTFALTATVMLMFVAGLFGVGLFRTTGWLFDTAEFVQRKPDFL
jgi:hypothetical protein